MIVLKINNIDINPAPKGTDAQCIVNHERRRLACKYLQIDASLCDVQLNTLYISCIDNVVITVEPNGTIVKHLLYYQHIVYMNGDAIQTYKGTISDLEFDAVNKIPDSIFRHMLNIATKELVFSSVTSKQFIKECQFTYNKRTIDELIGCIDRRLDAINRWYIKCSTTICKIQMHDLSDIRKYLTKTACAELWYDTNTTNHIIDKAIMEIVKLINL